MQLTPEMSMIVFKSYSPADQALHHHPYLQKHHPNPAEQEKECHFLKQPEHV